MHRSSLALSGRMGRRRRDQSTPRLRTAPTGDADRAEGPQGHEHHARRLGDGLAVNGERQVRRGRPKNLTSRSGICGKGITVSIHQQAAAGVLDVEFAPVRVADVGHIPEPLAAGQLGAIDPPVDPVSSRRQKTLSPVKFRLPEESSVPPVIPLFVKPGAVKNAILTDTFWVGSPCSCP